MKWLIALLLCSTTAWASTEGYGSELAEPPAAYSLPADFVWPEGLFKTVLVTGSGDTPHLARADAFRTAVEQVAGIAITSQTQVSNFRLAYDHTQTHTQARISNFAIVTMIKRQGVWHCQLWATVRGS